MSERVVILGPVRGGKLQAREISPMDAGAYLGDSGGNWRLSLALWAGPLANATVLMRVKDWAAEDGEVSARQRGEDIAWETVGIMSPRSIPFEIELPLTTAECRPS